MKAAVMRGGALVVDEVADPTPKPGQVLVRTIACGICGSDLHVLAHADQFTSMSDEMRELGGGGLPMGPPMDITHDVVMGHEYCGEVLELGENTGNCAVGDHVVSVPMVFGPEGLSPIGYSNLYPGGYGELMVLSDMMCLKVPNGLDPHLAALTEPMAVGAHAVARGRMKQGTAAIVLGCGPVGLAVIAELTRRGIEPIVAADFSPARRALAVTMGAHEVVDPAAEPVIDAWRRIDGHKPLVIFEAVGVPGLIDQAISMAPGRTRIVVVGVCMEADTIHPMRAVVRELEITFAMAYDPAEFADTLRAIAEGELDVAPLVTGRIPVEGVPQAFADLADPEAHAKILVVPTHEAAT